MRLALIAIVDFLPIFLTVMAVLTSVVHNKWAIDETKGNYFALDPERFIYFETYIYYLGDRASMIIYAVACILLTLNRWKPLVEMYRHAFLVLLLCWTIVLIDYLITGNKDIMQVGGFDVNTCILGVYFVYCFGFFIKRLKEIINYAEKS